MRGAKDLGTRPNGQDAVWVILSRRDRKPIRVNATKVRSVGPRTVGHALITFEDGRKIEVIGEPNAVAASLQHSPGQPDSFCITASGMSKLA
jgi:hypothetical protein